MHGAFVWDRIDEYYLPHDVFGRVVFWVAATGPVDGSGRMTGCCCGRLVCWGRSGWVESIPGRSEEVCSEFGSCLEVPSWLISSMDWSGWCWIEPEVEAPSQADVGAESPFDWLHRRYIAWICWSMLALSAAFEIIDGSWGEEFSWAGWRRSDPFDWGGADFNHAYSKESSERGPCTFIPPLWGLLFDVVSFGSTAPAGNTERVGSTGSCSRWEGCWSCELWPNSQLDRFMEVYWVDGSWKEGCWSWWLLLNSQLDRFVEYWVDGKPEPADLEPYLWFTPCVGWSAFIGIPYDAPVLLQFHGWGLRIGWRHILKIVDVGWSRSENSLNRHHSKLVGRTHNWIACLGSDWIHSWIDHENFATPPYIDMEDTGSSSGWRF